jgi:serine protease Do
VDYTANANKDWQVRLSEFPYLKVSSRNLDEGEAIYSFGYPLSSPEAESMHGGFIGVSSLCPRTTSAIVSSTLEMTTMVMTSKDPKRYVLDKALNYGNSGGPIVSVETGHVHALCSRFQPVCIPQGHLKDSSSNPLYILIPSLYGVVSSLITSD